MNPVVAIHLSAALGALALGPLALWARQGTTQRPRLHRAFGYAWVTLMVVAAVSAIFIHNPKIPGIGGFGPIHIFVPLTFAGLFGAFHALAKGNIAAHKSRMQKLYYAGCVGPAVFSLLPGRFLGKALGIQSVVELAILAAIAAIAFLTWQALRRRRPAAHA